MHGFTDPYGRKRTVTGGVSFCPYKSVFVRICPFISKIPLGEGVSAASNGCILTLSEAQ